MKNLRDYAITPVFQYNYTQGKNASDSALIIDAMDILYSGNVDGFCIVTSDSDFTKLVLRLRESGMTVIGMGERKTPNAFVSACETFKFLDILLNDENPSQNPSLPQTHKESEAGGSRKRQRKKAIRMQSAIFRTWRRWRKRLSRSSTHMRTMTDGWIYRSWETTFQSVCRDLTREIIKCTKLKQFIELFDSVEVRSARNPHNKILSIIYVRVKQKEEKPVLSKVRRGGKRKKDADAEE